MELRNEKDAQFIIRHHVTEEKLLHLEKGVRKLGFQSGGKRIMSIFLGLFLLCMAAKVVIGGTIGDALMMIGILCAMGFVKPSIVRIFPLAMPIMIFITIARIGRTVVRIMRIIVPTSPVMNACRCLTDETHIQTHRLKPNSIPDSSNRS